MSLPILMYHELELEGRKTCRGEPGYMRYVLRFDDFARQMGWLSANGFEASAVGPALAEDQAAAPRRVVLTFDDGCETDALIAAPLLARYGFTATFYVVSDWIGTPGFLAPAQLRGLADAGFEIGSHSKTHAFLPDLDDARLREELVESRDRVQQIIGRPVLHLSCPGGRWSRRVADTALDAGYRTVATSRFGVNDPDADPAALRRVPIVRDTSPRRFERVCNGEQPRAARLAHRALDLVKTLLGNSTYCAVRDTVLRASAQRFRLPMR